MKPGSPFTGESQLGQVPLQRTRQGDEDIPTHDDAHVAIQGPITRTCACQLQYQVKSFLSSTPCQLQDILLPNEILRNEGQAYEGLKNQLGGAHGRGQGATQETG
jgi:hypothetical protein